MPKIAFITPSFPPKVCGVGDYSYKLCREMATLKQTVKVWTSQRDATKPDFCDLQIQSMPWNKIALEEILQSVRDWKPDQILIQYTPYLFAPKFYGIQWLLPWWVRKLKAIAPVTVNMHELHYPTQMNPRGLLIGVPQYLQYAGIITQASKVCFSYNTARNRTIALGTKLGKKNTHRFLWLPIGSNIDVVKVSPVPTSERKLPGLRLVHFGGAHPAHLYDFVFEAFKEVLRKYPTARLVLIGVNETFLKKQPEKVQELFSQIDVLGFLSEKEVSMELQSASLALAPFMEGITARRGSVMAAMAHGCPVVTNRGIYSDAEIPWSDISFLSPSDKKEDFIKTVLTAVAAREEKVGHVGKLGKEYYQSHFDWGVIAQSLLEFLYKT